MNIQDEECPNCGSINEVEQGENGSCERCGNHYVWEEIYDEDSDSYSMCLIWTSEFGDLDDDSDEED
jgi:hypothetical protein